MPHSFTTEGIHHACGIAEGTIFRVFEDKRELLLAASREAMSGDEEIARISQIRPELPLSERLTAALEALAGYQDRMWALMRMFRETGLRPDRGQHDPQHHPVERIAGAVGVLFEPDKDRLRLDALAAARMLLGLAFTNRMRETGLSEPAATAEQLVDLFLNGALARD